MYWLLLYCNCNTMEVCFILHWKRPTWEKVKNIQTNKTSFRSTVVFSKAHRQPITWRSLLWSLLCSNFMEFQTSLHVCMYICYFPVHWLFKTTSISLYNENYYYGFSHLFGTQIRCTVDFHLFNKISIKMEIPQSQIALTTKDGLAETPCSERVRMQSVLQWYS